MNFKIIIENYLKEAAIIDSVFAVVFAKNLWIPIEDIHKAWENQLPLDRKYTVPEFLSVLCRDLENLNVLACIDNAAIKFHSDKKVSHFNSKYKAY